MRKLPIVATLSLLALTLTGCNTQTEHEAFNQANIGAAFGPVMETDHAYYYHTNDLSYELHYYDKASGKSIFLCNKPECSHDGNEFCAATVGGRYVLHSALYEDGIYIAALECKDDRLDKKLFKVSLDGTKLEDICTYGYDPATDLIGIAYNDEKYMAIYEGIAFIPYSTLQKDDSFNYGTAIVDLDSGSVKYLEEYNSFTSSGQKGYIPYEDYLYYCVSDPYNRYPKLYRYHLSQKNTEEIPIPGGFNDFCIVEGEVIYTQPDAEGFYHIYALNPDTLEAKDLTGALTNADGTSLLREWDGRLLFDGEYLVTFASPNNEDHQYRYFVFTKDGSLLTDFSHPDTIDSHYDICMANGYVYFRDYYSMVRCSMQDILKGTPEWKPLFTTPTEAE